jgi:hypothetical protein
MSENKTPISNDPPPEATPAEPTTEEPGWESLEHDQPPAGQPGTHERTVVEILDERQTSTRRRAGRSRKASGDPAAAGRYGERAWLAVLALAALAACLGATILLTTPPGRVHPTSPPTGAKPCDAPTQRHARLGHDRRPARRAKAHPVVRRAPARAAIESGPSSFPQAPETPPAAATGSAPVQQAVTEGEQEGGPFSP